MEHNTDRSKTPPATPAKFAAGRIVATPGALAALGRVGETPETFVGRHLKGDWGDVSAADAAENEASLAQGFRLLSAYRLGDGTRIWCITEADRSSTCVLLPGEY